MPLIRIDSHQKAEQAEMKNLLDATHRAVLSAFKVLLGDRYQVSTVVLPICYSAHVVARRTLALGAGV